MRQAKDIIAMFRSFALPVDRDVWELGEIGQRRTYLGPAGHAVHATHVVETVECKRFRMSRLINIMTGEHNAAMRTNGSFSASLIGDTVRIALSQQ